MYKSLLFVVISCFYSISANANHSVSNANSANTELFIVHFETGPNWDPSLAPSEQIKFKAHSKNLNQLRKEKVISFGARYNHFGVIFIKATSLADATSLIAKDPGVQAGIFTFNIAQLKVFYPWEK